MPQASETDTWDSSSAARNLARPERFPARTATRPRPPSPRAPSESAGRRTRGTGREKRAKARVAAGPRSRLPRHPVRAQLADHQLAERVVEVCRIIGAARRLLAGVARIWKALLAGTSVRTRRPSSLGVQPIADRKRTSRSSAAVIWPMCCSGSPLPSPSSHIISSP